MRGFRRRQEEAREALIESAREAMSFDDMVGCAVRRDRLRRRESQRAYAVRRGLSSAFVARLESRPGDLGLGAVLSGLEPTAHGLALVPTGMRSCVATTLVAPSAGEVGAAVHEMVEASGGSLRCFAETVGLSRSMLSRAQNTPAGLKLGVIRGLLGKGGLTLAVAEREGGMVLQPDDWDVGEIAARVRGGQRRLAGHRVPLHTPEGPSWWWRTTAPLPPGVLAPQWTTLAPHQIRDIPAHQYAPRWIDPA